MRVLSASGGGRVDAETYGRRRTFEVARRIVSTLEGGHAFDTLGTYVAARLAPILR